MWADGPSLLISELQEPGEEWIVYEAARDGHIPTLNDGVDGFVITGSHYNLSAPETADLPWVKAVAAFLRDAVHLGAEAACEPKAETTSRPPAGKGQHAPIVAICFGAQLVGQAFGGVVSRNPHDAFLLRAEEIRPRKEFAALPSAKGIILDEGTVRDVNDTTGIKPGSEESDKLGTCGYLRLFVSHGDCVSALPPGAVHLAESDACRNEMFLVGDNILAMQSHPEFTMAIIDTKIWPNVVCKKEKLSPEQQEFSLASFKLPRHSMAARAIIKRFLLARD
jgi:GMP synthase-like glutamine amidotransferase